MTAGEFKEWLHTSKAGQPCIYHTGFLAVDRGFYVGTVEDIGFIPNPVVHELAKDVLQAWDDNKIHLFQRKLHDSVYQYIAVKKSKYGRQW